MVINKCQRRVTEGYYLDNGVVKACQDVCRVCDSANCYDCREGYMLLQGKCVEECPTGYYPQDSQCQRCPLTCSSCLSPSACVSCVSPFAPMDGDCVLYS